MYNRYIPQPDGSYRRRSMQEPAPQQRQTPKPPETQWKPEPAPSIQEESCPQPTCQPTAPRQRRNSSCRKPSPPSKPKPEPRRESGGNVTDFLRNLLPKDFDTGDLLIVLLLLLMSGDCQEDQNSALLTLVLYLFL